MKKVPNKLQVRHYPQIPCKPFCIDVKDENEAFRIIQILAMQHLFLLEHNIIPDFCNVIQVLMWEDNVNDDGSGDWSTYWNEEEMMEWEELESEYFMYNPLTTSDV